MARGRKTGGRQPGTPNSTTAATRAQIAAQVDPIAFLAQVMRGKAVHTAAGKGRKVTATVPTIEQRLTAARILTDKLVPNAKGRPIRLDLPAIDTAADVLKAQAAALGAMARGEITPEEASTIAAVLDARRKAVETAELERRVDELERKAGTK